LVELEKIETFNIRGLTKEDISFLSEILEKISLSEESSPLSRELLAKWKTTSKTWLEQSKEPSYLGCEVCEIKHSSHSSCPITEESIKLCDDCYQARKKHYEQESN